ncbi:hypothetical protein C0991_009990 [Blastosporella zonata]|nr:hypothetical protein C0991_009990 [Blastosporella zonata]
MNQSSCTSTASTLACLRAVDVGTLQAINTNISGDAFFGTFIFVPVVDGSFIRQRPTQALREHKVNGKVLLAVTNTDEGFIFINQNSASTVTTASYVSQLFPKFGAREIAGATAQYTNLGTPINQADLIMGEG